MVTVPLYGPEPGRVCAGGGARSCIEAYTTYDPRHYLSLLARKPGAFDIAKPLEGWELPDCFAVLRRRLENEFGTTGTREYIEVLGLLADTTIEDLAAAVDVALSIGAPSTDAIRRIVACRAEGLGECQWPG